MNFKKQYRNSKILFALSLILLVGFLSVWLQNIYQDKVEELENKVSYLWIKSIKEVEGMDFTKIIFTTIVSSSDSFTHDNLFTKLPVPKKFIPPKNQPQPFLKALSKQEEVKIMLHPDTLSFVGRTSQMVVSDSSVNIDIQANIDTTIITEDISNFGEAPKNKFLQALAQLNLDTALVISKLDSELKKAAIPIHYNIRKVKADTILNNVPDKFKIKTTNGTQYLLQLNDYEGYVIKNMWFEFLISFILLGIIATAFYYILHHLKEQNKLVQIKNDLISNITHELRTPIFTVSAALEALQNFNGLSNPERTKEYLEISQNELNRLSILVEKVLKTSLFEQSVISISKEPFQLNLLVQGIANSWQLQLEKQNASLTIESSNENIEIYADKIHFTNIIYNLIDNALKYSSNKTPVIKIALKDLENAVQIVVSDNGIGIPKEYLNQIFEKFFRVPKGNEHSVKGHGLGLNYVAEIVKLHQGTITANSQEGVGAEFVITLPKSDKA